MASRGSYQTRRQEAVAALFEARPDECLTAEEAYEALTAGGMVVGKTTVYRAIARLCDAGALRRYAAHDQREAASYQHNPCREGHLHIRCIRCGALGHLSCGEAEAFAAHLEAEHGFVLDAGQTLLYGCCAACRGEEALPPAPDGEAAGR